MPDPAGRFSVGFDDVSLAWDVAWTHLDQEHPNLITSYQIDRGRQFELDRTDGGRASVEVIDADGILDPTNPAGPYYGKLEPLLPARLGRRNPVTGEWFDRFRGFIEEFDYTIDPNQRVGRLTLSLIDIYEILASIDMQLGPEDPPAFGDPPPAAHAGNLFFAGAPSSPEIKMQQRIEELLGVNGVGLDERWSVVFSGNVYLWATVYSPGESVMTVIQEAADAEFPGVSNVYPDRHGRLCVHGRLAKFDPEGVEAGVADSSIWDFREFTVGDAEAVAAAPAITAQIRRFAYNRGLSKIINDASAWPWRPEAQELSPAQLAGQTIRDSPSILQRGFRSWTAQNLLTYKTVPPNPVDDLTETKRFARYYVDNYRQPRDRVTEIAFRSMRPGAPGAEATWNLLSRVDIADSATLTMHGPLGGEGVFDGERFFVEGIHEEARPLNADYDDVTVSLDLSPRAYYPPVNPWS